MKFIFVLVMLMGNDPYPTFAFTQTFKTMDECLTVKEATIESIKNKKEAEKRLGCMMIVNPKTIKIGQQS